MKMLFLLLVLFTQAVPAERNTAGDYRVGPEDVLAISVVGEAELSNRYTVGRDGSFEFPWIGRVNSKGQTLRALEALIAKRLLDGRFLVNDPQVSIQVAEYRSQKVYVQGEVRKPGHVRLTGAMTIMDVLAEAELLPTAGEELHINRRKTEGGEDDGPVLDAAGKEDIEVITIRKDDVFSGRAARLVMLQHGDTINVLKGLSIFVSGQVKAPNRYNIEGKINVLQAITMAGGPTDRGAVNRTKILRVVNGKQVEIKAKLTDAVLPGDQIVVPAKYF